MSTLIANIVCFIQTALHLAVNAIVAAVGSFAAFILSLLPDMPGFPAVPSLVAQGVRYAYYVCDVGWLIAYMTTYLALLALVFLVMIPLRWMKAVE